MERIDSQKARQVWQRVTAPPQPRQNQEDLRRLLLGAMEREGAYRALGPAMNGRSKELFQQLMELIQANRQCLAGLCRLAGSDLRQKERTVPIEPPAQALMRSFYAARSAAAEYTARSVDPDFGLVFREMAEREGKLCSLTAQLLGFTQLNKT